MKAPRTPTNRTLLLVALASSFVRISIAQGPPPPPPLQPLAAPVAPAGNPITVDKTQLGKALFWDEQLSSTRTVACGSCHQPVAGGSDPRSTPTTLHPGADGVFGNGDDIVGSPGVIDTGADGLHNLDDFFGMTAQVTGRYSPSAINSAYPPTLFWDGRATGTFSDPVTGDVVLPAGAALESQAAGPPTSDVEMAHAGRDWNAVASRLAHAVPLALAPTVPADLTTWIDGRGYEELFQAAFGSAGVTPTRIILAIATYERSLVSNQSPIDAFIAGTPGALTPQEQQGLNLFRTQGCAACHAGNRFTDDNFHYIGVRPQADDPGRFGVTGNIADRGRFKTPTLRNVALRGEFMHNGGFETLAEVVDFYDRGGDFDAPNKNPGIQPLDLTVAEKAALVAFLGRPLTDPRVAAETGTFSRPALSAGSSRTPAITGTPVADDFGNLPRVVAVEPPLAGSANFTVGLSRVPVGSSAMLVLDDEPIASTGVAPASEDVLFRRIFTVEGGSAWDATLGTNQSGFASASLAIPGGSTLRGTKLHGRWFVFTGTRFGESATFEATVFGETAGVLAAPTDAEADVLAGNTVELTWNAASGATAYDVYRATTSNFLEANYRGRTGLTEFLDETAEPENVYHYWIVALNADEASEPSVPLEVSTYNLDGFSLTAADGASTTATALSWPSQGNAGTYQIHRGLSADPEAMTQIGETGGTSYSDTTGTALRPYHYRIVARDEDGDYLGNSVMDPGHRSLAAPTTVTATDGTHTDRIALAWSAVAEAETYAVFRTIDGATATLWRSTAATSLDDTEVAPGSTVAYRVQSRNAYGNGETSATATGRRAYEAPSGVTAAAGASPGEIALSWNEVLGAAGYAVYRGLTGDFDDAEEIARAATNGYLDDEAAPGTDYHYWIAALDAEGDVISLNPTSVTVTLTPVAAVDLLVRNARGIFLGDGVLNTSGVGQSATFLSDRYETVKTAMRARNDGDAPDSFRYALSGSSLYCRVLLTRTSPTAENLTASAKTGRAASGTLAPGSLENLELRVEPLRTAAAKRVKRYRLISTLRATSARDTAKLDAVKATVIASE